MVMALTFTSQGQRTKENGWMISSMASVLKDGKMELITRASTDRDASMERESLFGLMGPHLRATSLGME